MRTMLIVNDDTLRIAGSEPSSEGPVKFISSSNEERVSTLFQHLSMIMSACNNPLLNRL